MNAPDTVKPRTATVSSGDGGFRQRQRFASRLSSSAASSSSKRGSRRSAPSSRSTLPPRGPLRIARPSAGARARRFRRSTACRSASRTSSKPSTWPTENGSPLFAGFRSERDTASVAALREAGAVIVGKTVTTEFAWMQPRATKNPWDLSRTPGGSSSGSAAAVAVGAISVGIGTQVFGSIVRPSSFCGCFGFKPTVGAINRGGSHDALSQSTHGPIAASLPEAWAVAYEISRRAGGDPGYPGLYGPPTCPAPSKPRRLAVLETDGWAVATAAAKEALEEARRNSRSAGVTLVSRPENETDRRGRGCDP